jgi:hypothetical protein
VARPSTNASSGVATEAKSGVLEASKTPVYPKNLAAAGSPLNFDTGKLGE